MATTSCLDRVISARGIATSMGGESRSSVLVWKAWKGSAVRRRRGERGQILPLVAIALVALLGIGAFAIDVGYAYYAKRQLQSATDAAALAGAQDLPNADNRDRDGDRVRGRQHAREPVSFSFTYQVKCTATAVVATGCNCSRQPERADRDRHGAPRTPGSRGSSGSSTSTSRRTRTPAVRAPRRRSTS